MLFLRGSNIVQTCLGKQRRQVLEQYIVHTFDKENPMKALILIFSILSATRAFAAATCDESGQTIPAGISMGSCQICRAFSGGSYFMYIDGVATHDEAEFLGQNGQQSSIFTLQNVKKSYYYHIGAGDCGVTCQAN
jgi:hypothetical protein